MIKKLIGWCVFVFIPLRIWSATAVVIDSTDLDKTYYWMGPTLQYFADPGGKVNIQDILAGTFDSKFLDAKDDVPLLPNNCYYWVKISVLKKSHDSNFWLFEAYDQSIDEIEFYAPDKTGNYHMMKSGELQAFSSKPYQHKNHLFELHLTPYKEQIIYLRVRDKMKMAMIGAVRNQRSLMNYALSEYFYLSLFYGFVLCMVLVTVSNYLTTRKKNYFIYLLYLLVAGLFTLTSDGLGFQFIWNNFPYMNNELGYLAMFGVIGLVYVLTKTFLGDLKLHSGIEKTILALLALRLMDAMAQILFARNFLPDFYIDMLIRALLLASIVRHYMDGHRHLRYFALALGCLMLGYMLRQFAIQGFIPNNYITIYMNLWGEAFQMILITLALSDQLKQQMQDGLRKQETAMKELEIMNRETEQIRIDLQQRVNEQISREKFLSEGISELSKIIARHQHDPNELYQQVCAFLATRFDFGLVAFYVPDMQQEQAILRSGYGLDEQRLSLLGKGIDHGLIGQCLIDKRKMSIDNVPQDFLSIGSGLGQRLPQQIVIEPLLFNEKLVGILEYASFHLLKDLEKELLQRVLDQISSVMSYAAFTETTNRLLKESREIEDELRIKQEDMNQQLEEMLTTQEEYTLNEQEYIRQIEELKAKLGEDNVVDE